MKKHAVVDKTAETQVAKGLILFSKIYILKEEYFSKGTAEYESKYLLWRKRIIR